MPATRPVVRVLFAIVSVLASFLADGAQAKPPSLLETLAARDRDALWKLVDGLCVPDMREHGRPAPCEQVDLQRGFVVYKDIQGHSQLLLMPTRRMAGIEDPSLLEPSAPNYWQYAWGARATFERHVGHPVPRETIGLAINSAIGRSQDQLHIHVDCLRPDVVAALRAHGARIGRRWSDFPAPLDGRSYRAMRLTGEGLGTRDPFKLLATGDASARAEMGLHTLVVAGYRSAKGADGFVLLDHRADPDRGDRGHGEDLLDHGCAVLAPIAR